MSRAIAALLWASSLCLLSCGGARPAPPPEPIAPETPAPPPEPIAPETPAPPPEPIASETPAPPPEPEAAPAEPRDPEQLAEMLELVRANVASTDLSALAVIRGARVEGPNGGPPPTTGYVNLIYDVDIVTPIRGCGKTTSFSFAEMAEAGYKPMKDGTALLVSVCRDGDGRYHTPDVGYAIPQSELPANAAERLAAKPPKGAASACRD